MTRYRKPSKFAPRKDRWAVHKMNLYGSRKDQQRIGFRRELDSIYQPVRETWLSSWLSSPFPDINRSV